MRQRVGSLPPPLVLGLVFDRYYFSGHLSCFLRLRFKAQVKPRVKAFVKRLGEACFTGLSLLPARNVLRRYQAAIEMDAKLPAAGGMAVDAIVRQVS